MSDRDLSQAERLLVPVGALLRAFHVNERAFPPGKGRIAYSPHVFQALGFIAANPGARAADLAAFMGLSPATASSLLARLEGRGLVAKARHPDDGRAVALSLTEEGADLFGAIHRQDTRNMDLMLSALSKAERAVFIDMMERVAGTVLAVAEGQ